MATPSPLEIEGRLHGQREVLAVVVAHLLAQPGDDFRRLIEAQQVIADHQEDPGAVLDPAFVFQAAAAQEVRQVLDRAEALRAGQ
ncbi:hypothetical protein [Pararhodobacter sp.]|uniref:hypothetical protein n=1 Tax=Pararhodobacter sp. TaxID=2127056 RepID=UPI002FDEEE14